jgi:substrate import-associated zinc metallohydrolase lipoprotein
MKSLKYYISPLLVAGAAVLALNSCSDDDFTESIFPDGDEQLDPNSTTYKFDKWLQQNYLEVYNLDFRYKMQDVGTNMNYNLVPATYQNSVDLAVLAKYLWFDVYKDVVNPEFLKQYGPRIIHLIGSPAHNPTTGTIILGLAEGGIKVSLFRVNQMDVNDFNQMNEYYFKTMHHEFAHILHQKKTYPSEFNKISAGHYDASNWQNRQVGVVNSLGFVTTYASDAFREDFAETIANYITKTDEQWAEIYEMAARGWETPSTSASDPDAVYYCWYYYANNKTGDENKKYAVDKDVITDSTETGVEYHHRSLYDADGNPLRIYPVEDKDGIDGVAALKQKIEIARTWLKDKWGVDLDKLRKEVQYRQQHIDMKALRQQIENVK